MTRHQGSHVHKYVHRPPMEETCMYLGVTCDCGKSHVNKRHRYIKDPEVCAWKVRFCRSHPDKWPQPWPWTAEDVFRYLTMIGQILQGVKHHGNS